jgi:hypothetical protein
LILEPRRAAHFADNLVFPQARLCFVEDEVEPQSVECRLGCAFE